VTDAAGLYQMDNLAPGTHTLTFTMVGYHTLTVQTTVHAGRTTTLAPVRQSERPDQLEEVVVQAEQLNKFARKASVHVSKMPLKDMENPQVYQSISSELLQDQLVTHFDDALKNAPGIDNLWESTGRGGDGAGYFSLRGFAVQPTMIN